MKDDKHKIVHSTYISLKHKLNYTDNIKSVYLRSEMEGGMDCQQVQRTFKRDEHDL